MVFFSVSYHLKCGEDAWCSDISWQCTQRLPEKTIQLQRSLHLYLCRSEFCDFCELTNRSTERTIDRLNEDRNNWLFDWSKNERMNERQKTNDKRRTVNKEGSIMNNEQANDRRTSGETYRPSNKKTKKRASERKNDRTTGRTTYEWTNEPTDYERSDRRIFKHLLTQPDIFLALFVVNDHVKDSVTLLSELNTDRFPLFTGIIVSYLLEISEDGSTVGLWLTPQVWTDHADKYTRITLSRVLHTKIHGIFKFTIHSIDYPLISCIYSCRSYGWPLGEGRICWHLHRLWN